MTEHSVAVLGATGSIGTQTLEVCGLLGMPVAALCAGKNIGLLEEQARRFRPALVSVADTESGKTLKMTTTSSVASIVPAYASWTMDRPKDWTPRTWDPDDSRYTIAGYTATIPAGTTVKFTTVLAD